MNTRMFHPEHGWHHAYTAQEEADMRDHGWLPEVAPAQETPPAGFPPLTAEPVPALPKRRGRPPKVKQ